MRENTYWYSQSGRPWPSPPRSAIHTGSGRCVPSPSRRSSGMTSAIVAVRFTHAHTATFCRLASVRVRSTAA
jgi:hypothetical protein